MNMENGKKKIPCSSACSSSLHYYRNGCNTFLYKVCILDLVVKANEGKCEHLVPILFLFFFLAGVASFTFAREADIQT